jgi:hypothetical protein
MLETFTKYCFQTMDEIYNAAVIPQSKGSSGCIIKFLGNFS